MEETPNTVEAWKNADALARAAESRLKDAWEAHANGGPPPTESLMNEVKALREAANEKLSAAMARMGSTGHAR
ncbi:hypothetical protein [Ramlibacter albus]|uniref:Uncharacterized protein n=1 Tax=Ramlibacter albus TaxID=2079448 RepID=A0A923MAU0_9BURK|nr:hypothetical protein [Ramlibacter albus]MBC5767013.1 hypothetical protein [Ramlibacter albus]